jgi:hypothetical protein
MKQSPFFPNGVDLSKVAGTFHVLSAVKKQSFIFDYADGIRSVPATFPKVLALSPNLANQSLVNALLPRGGEGGRQAGWATFRFNAKSCARA